jgi:predicted nucleotidyltransferase
MKVLGLIVEYNPMHFGHLYHIEKAKELIKPDFTVALMSGHGMQRGELSIYDKFTRAEIAVNNGIDLVIELPFALSVQSAEFFAEASISALHELGVTDLVFGSEADKIEELSNLLNMTEDESFNQIRQSLLDEGFSFPTATTMALNVLGYSDDKLSPNNILGLEYLKQIKKQQTKINPHIVKRVESHYYEQFLEDKKIQSATAIRKRILSNQSFKEFIIDSRNKNLDKLTPLSWNKVFFDLRYRIISSTKEDLADISLVKEGIENRILKVDNFTNFDKLIEDIISKRYTNAYLKRVLLNILVNNKLKINGHSIPYLRILAMNTNGQSYLNKIKKSLRIPLYTTSKKGLHDMMDLDIRVSKLYDSYVNRDIYKKEFLKPIICK